MNTKAAVLHKIKMDRPYHLSKPLKIENVTLDNPGFNEVIVKINLILIFVISGDLNV